MDSESVNKIESNILLSDQKYKILSDWFENFDNETRKFTCNSDELNRKGSIQLLSSRLIQKYVQHRFFKTPSKLSINNVAEQIAQGNENIISIDILNNRTIELQQIDQENANFIPIETPNNLTIEFQQCDQENENLVPLEVPKNREIKSPPISPTRNIFQPPIAKMSKKNFVDLTHDTGEGKTIES